jgi:hypothetical protein
LRETSIAHLRRWAAAFAALSLAAVVALAAASPGVAGSLKLEKKKRPPPLAQLLAGKPLDGVEIHGAVDLSNKTVKQPFECTNCHFDQAVQARNAVFTRLVNFAGSTFGGAVTMTGATFDAPALFGSPSAKSSFGDADFTLATFLDLADFEGAGFTGSATFVLTRFRSDAIFAGEGSTFGGPVSFDRASFAAAADFRQRSFSQTPDFARATFSGRSDFSDSALDMGAMFNAARFGTETSFLGATFGKAPCSRSGEPGKQPCAETVFDNVRAAGEINFTSAKIPGTLSVTNVDVSGLTFANAIFEKSPCESRTPGSPKTADQCEEEDGELRIESVRAPDFFIDIDSLNHVVLSDPSSTDQSRREVLGLLESSAKSHNDLALANDAHYRLQSLKSNDYWTPFHWLDVFFYRWIAGYLVRPDHPLFTLLALAILVSVIRVLLLVPMPPPVPEASRVRPAWARRFHTAADTPSRIAGALRGLRVSRRLGSWLKDDFRPGSIQFGHELLDTLRLIWPGSAATAKGRRFEAFGYRVLFVCMLFGFANSNPTLRQMLDALL